METSFFLRFTADPARDLQVKRSVWNLSDTEIEGGARADGYHADGTPFMWHKGLSGFALEAETIEEAVEEAQSLEHDYFYSVRRDAYAIFEGYSASHLSGAQTFEGDDFRPVSIAYVNSGTADSTSL